jgi:MinD superfamily P-loop ATPase
MREIVVISGKGGTGKTSLTAAFAALARGAVLCDLDVDVPDLHLLLSPQVIAQEAFVSGFTARVDASACFGCGKCRRMCRFDAIRPRGGVFEVDEMRCEGCNVCVTFCPKGAVRLEPRHCGEWYRSETRFGPMLHAQLFPGQENSGRLVALLKAEARNLAAQRGLDLILCDGPPGLGCPVISSLSGADLAVIVTEPTPSGHHDLLRVAELCEHFKIPIGVIVNKVDLNPAGAARIEASCAEHGHAVLARLPHDEIVTAAMVERRAVTEIECDFSQAVRTAWSRIQNLLDRGERCAAVGNHRTGNQ